MKQAIFPGSFDPFTAGHMDVLRSALKLFDNVTVAVGYNSSKKGFFDADTRIEIIKKATEGMKGVSVCKYEGLTVDLCKRMGISYMIRGLRTTTDFEMESVVAQANQKLAPDILTVFIPASGEYSFISSTVVRDVLIHGGNTKGFMPDNVNVAEFLKK